MCPDIKRTEIVNRPSCHDSEKVTQWIKCGMLLGLYTQSILQILRK